MFTHLFFFWPGRFILFRKFHPIMNMKEIKSLTKNLGTPYPPMKQASSNGLQFDRVIMIQSFKIEAQRLLLRKLKIIMLAIWQKSKPRWFWENKHIKCNVNLVFKIKNWANLRYPWPNALEQLWWTNSGPKFCRDEPKIKLEICREKKKYQNHN